MESKLFHYVSFSVILSILGAFILIPVADVTGFAAAVDTNGGSQNLLFIVFLLLGTFAILTIRFSRSPLPETVNLESQQELALNYIDRGMAQGLSPLNLERNLVEQGWPEDYVRRIISDKYYLALQSTRVQARPRKKRRHYWF